MRIAVQVAVRSSRVLALGAFPLVAHASSPIVPPAMIDACKGKPAASACAFTMSGKNIQGACTPLPEGTLACRPGAAPRPKKGKGEAAPPPAAP